MLMKGFVSFVILAGVRINCVKPKSCNIDLYLQLSNLFKKLKVLTVKYSRSRRTLLEGLKTQKPKNIQENWA